MVRVRGLAALVVLLSAGQARADGMAQLLSDSVAPAALVASAGLWAFGGEDEQETGRRCADGLLATGALATGLKSVTDQPRPNDPRATDGFPSRHVAASFCLAAILADREPDSAWPAYLWAGAVGWSRVELGAHDLTQVLAGAALGYLVGRESVGDDGVFGDAVVTDAAGPALLPSLGSRTQRPRGLPLVTVCW